MTFSDDVTTGIPVYIEISKALMRVFRVGSIMLLVAFRPNKRPRRQAASALPIQPYAVSR